jgi:splicing factor 3B subunit 3
MCVDYIVMGSDSGAIVVMEFHVDGKSFKLLHKETFGKSGSRRLAPGQYLACDPKGRACMIAAVEKQKFVYTLNRDSEGTLTISSPLEAHKSHMITYSLIGVDVGYENPFFAALEHDYFPFDKLKRGEDSDSLPKKVFYMFSG